MQGKPSVMRLYPSLFLFFFVLSGSLFAQPVSQKAAKFCNDNFATYNLIDATIKEYKKNKPDVPQPVAVEMSCQDCDDAGKGNKSKQAIDAWVKSLTQHEEEMIKTLLQMQHDWVEAGGTSKEAANMPDCYKKFSEADFQEKISFLRDRIFLDKILPMARKWKGNASTFLAGTQAIAQTVHYAVDNSRFAEQEEAAQLALEWTKAYCDMIENAVTKSYQYHLYAALLFDANNAVTQNPETAAYIQKTIEKLNDFMHFKLKVEFEASGHGDNGGKYHALASGEGNVKARIENNCVVWEMENGEEMKFNVKEVLFKSDQGQATYVGPQQFSVPVSLKSTLCGDEAKLKISFAKFGADDETYVAEGQQFQSPLLYSLAMATLGSANYNRMKGEAANVQQKAEKFSGKEAAVDAAAKRLREHQNDPNYLKTPQGKADMDMMRQMAKDLGYTNVKAPDPKRMKNLDNLRAMNEAQQKINAKYTQPGYVGSPEYQKDKADLAKLKGGVNLNDLSNAAGFDMNMLMVEAPFQNGSKTAADKTQKDKIKEIAGSQNGWEFGQFHITLEQTGSN